MSSVCNDWCCFCIGIIIYFGSDKQYFVVCIQVFFNIFNRFFISQFINIWFRVCIVVFCQVGVQLNFGRNRILVYGLVIGIIDGEIYVNDILFIYVVYGIVIVVIYIDYFYDWVIVFWQIENYDCCFFLLQLKMFFKKILIGIQ